jgi:hypothetical protein
MSAKDWQRLKFASYATVALSSGLFWVWGLAGVDPGRWLAQGNALIVVMAVLLAQTADVLGDRTRHRERAEEIQRIHPDAIGDRSCQFNARSPIIRCAVNPTGPCEGCQHYQVKGT